MAGTDARGAIAETLKDEEANILGEWTRQQIAIAKGRMEEPQIQEECRRFLSLFRTAAQQGDLEDTAGRAWDDVREMLAQLSRSRALEGFSPSDTATFVFSLKRPLFSALQRKVTRADDLARDFWGATLALDALGLYTTEVYQKSRNEVINRQQQEMLELSTPVVRLWEGVLALPLIGTLDSNRTSIVMESLLEKIVETGAAIAIIDITGVPTVDTLVAQHLLKTVAAARLMGADCIISGIRPQIAQTIIHLGIDLAQVTTKATLADAFAVALQRTGMAVTRREGRPPAAAQG